MFDVEFVRFLVRRARWHLQNLNGIHQVTRRAPGTEIRQGVTIINPDRFHCGRNTRIESGCFIHCGGNAWSNYEGEISLGDGCCLAQNNVLYGAGGIEAGDLVETGPGVLIFSSRDDYSREHAKKPTKVHQFSKVVIGSYSIIFSGAVIVPGVHIGEGAVIGAGSVVTQDVPAWTVAAGAPARPIGPRNIDQPIAERPRRTLTSLPTHQARKERSTDE